MDTDWNVVTGAFGYTGRYITRMLLSRGEMVKNLTGHPGRPNPFGDAVTSVPFRFDDLSALTNNLKGTCTLFNTYWIRFSHGELTFDKAVANSRLLIKAAKEAGVRRFVHISISNPSAASTLPYFRGKAAVEEALMQSGLSWVIIRPTVIFGREDILINNIAWLLRRFPVFAIPGTGDCRLQPVFAADVAEIAVNAAEITENLIINAAGPEVYTFLELVRCIAAHIESRARIVHLAPGLTLTFARLVGYLVGDVVLTKDELVGLTSDLLVTDDSAVGRTRFSEWIAENAASLGVDYASEISRHYR